MCATQVLGRVSTGYSPVPPRPSEQAVSTHPHLPIPGVARRPCGDGGPVDSPDTPSGEQAGVEPVGSPAQSCPASRPQLQELHRAGGDLTHRDERSRTLLHHAVSAGSKDVVRYLLEHSECRSWGRGAGWRQGCMGPSEPSSPCSPARDPGRSRGKVSVWVGQEPGDLGNQPVPRSPISGQSPLLSAAPSLPQGPSFPLSC